jgi:HTH-type transcriptional regulator/antitoxin HigA
MIKTDAQRLRKVAQIEGFQRALTEVPAQGNVKRTHALRASYESMIRQLEEDVREYDQLKSGRFTMPALDRLDQIAPCIVKLRIAKGVSQTELAARLGVSKQVISRSEDDDYQGVAIGRLQEFLDALQVRAGVSLIA